MKRSSTSESQSKSEIALKESEQRYRATMMSVGDGVIATDTEGRVEMMNPVAEELTGWKQEEARGKSLEKIFHIINEETCQTVENPVRRVMREGIVIGLANHTVLIAKDGTEHPIADSGSPIRNEKGDITGVVLVFRDQTQERTAQKALQESEEKYRNLVENASIGIVRTMIDGSKVLEANPKMCEILGLTREEFVGQPSAIAWAHPEQREDLVRLLREKGNVSNYEIDIRTKSGEIRTVIMSMTMYPELGYLEGGLQDITERKRADKALQESERKFRETIINLDEGYYSCMMNGVLLDHNQAFNRILGFDIDKDLKGSKLPDFWQNPDDRKVYLQELMTKGFIRNYLINAKKISGEKVVVMANSHLVKDEKGGLVRIEGTYNDFTEHKRLESEFKKSQDLLNKMGKISRMGAWELDVSTMKQIWTEETYEIHDVDKKTYNPNVGREINSFSPKSKPIIEKAVGDAIKNGKPYDLELEMITVRGNHKMVRAEGFAEKENGEIKRVYGTLQDITDRKLAEEQLRKLNRIYSLLSDINQAIVRTRVPNELFEKVCNISVEQGGFGMAWVGLIDESSQKLKVIAQAGRTNGYHEQVNISLKGKPLSYCPIDSTLRQGKHNICKITENEEIAPCQKTAYELGFRSSASFPLKVSDILKGALTFYSDESDFFDEAELKLLDELAMDISFAMEYAEKEAERKRAEETLKASEKRFRITAGSLIDVVYEWDLKEKIEWFGDIDGIMGYPDNGFPRTLAGWAAKLHPEDIEKVMATIEGHLKRSEPYISEYRVMNKEGEWRWWTARGTALRDEQNIPYWWIGSITDITGRKLAEEALKISKERLLFATEGANLGIWNWNIVTGELIWSDQCKALFGVPPDEGMSYQRFSDALHPDDRERTDKAVKDTLDNHKDFDIEYRSLWPDESIHWLAAKGRGFYDATGKAARLEGIVLDIDESKRAEEEIHKLNTELEERVAKRTSQLEASNKELEAFSYSVSHDLRAPLRHVSGYVELLNKHFQSDLPEKGQHYLNSISDSVRIMGMLIDDLLQFSKTGRMEMHQSDLDMNEIVKEVIESLCKDNPDRKIEWVLGKLASVNGDEAMLRLVWTNLLSNAVKFTRTRKKARIEIGVREEKKELVFFVRDNGVGFDMHYAQKLFGVFQRLHPTEEFEGTGIGLANVHRIVLRHRGCTWAEAEPDKGAVFYFSIPKK